MSLTLLESCKMYERSSRRQKSVPTFAEFNKKYFTCLPMNESIEQDFKSSVMKARKSYGMPITRRLPSLYHKLSGTSKPSSPSAPSAPSAVVQSSEKSFVYDNNTYDNAMKMNIRPPNCINTDNMEGELKEEDLSMKEYIKMVQSSSVTEAKGLIVHLIPRKIDESKSLMSLSCRLTKNNWEALCGKNETPIRMKDGSELNLKSIELNGEDMKSFVSDRKNKKKGPYFVRFSRI